MAEALSQKLRDVSKQMEHEASDPICFPPLIHRIREAELQCKRAELLAELAENTSALTPEDKRDIIDSLQSARGVKSDAQRDLQSFLKSIGTHNAKRYLCLAQKLQQSRRRSIALRSWILQGILSPKDACYRVLEARSNAFVSKASDAAKLLAVMEIRAKAVPAAPSGPLAPVQEVAEEQREPETPVTPAPQEAQQEEVAAEPAAAELAAEVPESPTPVAPAPQEVQQEEADEKPQAAPVEPRRSSRIRSRGQATP